MTIRNTQFEVSSQDFFILDHERVANMVRKSHFKDFTNFVPAPNKLYFTTRAISARVNRNFDGFPSQELKKSHHTFVGRPYFVNHANSDHRRTRGMLLASKFMENGNDRYIKLLCGIDANAFPKLSEEIGKGNLDGVSMGVDVEKTICSYCYRIARSPEDFCDHVLYMKGQTLERPNKFGRKESVLVFEACYGLNFFELSSVFDPADETALVEEVLLPRMAKAEAIEKTAFGESTAPPKVNTLREESNCPQCGDSSFDGTTCQFCGYNSPPGELQDPDLSVAQQIDEAQENNAMEDTSPLEESSSGGGLTDAIHETIENLEGLFELEQIVQQFAEGVAPSMPDDIDLSVPDMGEGVSGEGMAPSSLEGQDIPSDEVTDDSDGISLSEPSDEIAEDENSANDSMTLPEGQESPTEEVAVDQPPGQEVAPEEQQGIYGEPGSSEQEDNSGSDMNDIEQQVQDLVEGVDELVQQISGHSDNREEEDPEMPRISQQERTPALSTVSDRVIQAQKRLAKAQQKLSDLSHNVVQVFDDEAIADTPAPEAATSSTDAERGGEDARTNVQDLDANPATKEQEMRPEERQTVEMPTRSVAKLAASDVEQIFKTCDSKYSKVDLGVGLAKASYEYAKAKNLSPRIVFAQVLAVAGKRKGVLTNNDLKSLASMNNLFVRRIKAEDNDPYDMMSNTDNLQLAKPQDRVDVEAPVANDTNDYAQASQFDADKYDKNRGADIAKPDDVNTMNWWPGEKPKVTSNYIMGTTGTTTGNYLTPVISTSNEMVIPKASAVDAIKLAETYIDLGVFSANLKYDKVAEFEELPKTSVQQQQFALDAVRRAVAHSEQKSRRVVPRAVAGQRPVPQMGRAATFNNSSASDDATWLAL